MKFEKILTVYNKLIQSVIYLYHGFFFRLSSFVMHLGNPYTTRRNVTLEEEELVYFRLSSVAKTTESLTKKVRQASRVGGNASRYCRVKETVTDDDEPRTIIQLFQIVLEP